LEKEVLKLLSKFENRTMKIVLTGVETNNKGAELMLYAVLQEIERKFPNSTVYVEAWTVPQGLDYLKTGVKLRYWPYSAFVDKLHLEGIFSRLHIPTYVLKDTRAVKADYFLDGSGFCFSDQCGMWGRKADWWESLLKRQLNCGAKIVFLPQAFGPLSEENTKEAIRVLNRYASLIMPREAVSYEYLEKSGLVDMKKVRTYTDFTSLVEGSFPKKYEYLRNGICIIPNMKMIEKGAVTYDDYIRLLISIIQEGKKSGHSVYLLNHEGTKDEQLAYRCRDNIGEDIEVVTGLNALETKGMISSSYLVVTSRFHGLASALNCGVPSLATSWSHKYKSLFLDYELDDSYILPLDNVEKAIAQVKILLGTDENKRLRKHINEQVPRIKMQTKEMWNQVWNL